MIRERVISGLARARNQGIKLGRPMLQMKEEAIRHARANGEGIRRIARDLGGRYGAASDGLDDDSRQTTCVDYV